MLIGMVAFSQQGLAQQTAIERAYKFVEPETRIAFNKQLAELEQKKIVQGRYEAVEGLKASFYGRAVIQAGCIAEFCMITRKGIKGEDVIEYSNTCNDSQVKRLHKAQIALIRSIHEKCRRLYCT
jgi:RAB protein geranylgeranyltransferase component A